MLAALLGLIPRLVFITKCLHLIPGSTSARQKNFWNVFNDAIDWSEIEPSAVLDDDEDEDPE